MSEVQPSAQHAAPYKLLYGPDWPPREPAHLLSDMALLRKVVDRLESRGGHVVFARFPSTGDLRAAEEFLEPRQVYWRLLENAFPERCINFHDFAEMRALVCPDDSHLTSSAARAFTRLFIDQLRKLQLVSASDTTNCGCLTVVIERTTLSVRRVSPFSKEFSCYVYSRASLAVC